MEEKIRQEKGMGNQQIIISPVNQPYVVEGVEREARVSALEKYYAEEETKFPDGTRIAKGVRRERIEFKE